MGKRTSYEPGVFCWVDLITPDIAAGAAFYESVLGWKVYDDGGYHLFSLPGGDVAGGFQLDAAAGIPPHWNTHITVDGVDDTTARAVALGATVVQEPVDAHSAGRLAGLTDPTGAGFTIWQPRDRFGAELVNEPDCWCWNDLITRDPDVATSFYSRLFGWTYEDPDGDNEYRVIRHHDRQMGGVMQMPPEIPEQVPSSWEPYFNVVNLEDALDAVRASGGITPTGVMEVPDVGPFAIGHDPQGASFILIQAKEWDD